MKLIDWLLTAVLLLSCVSCASHKGSDEAANLSALYDPPTVTMLPSVQYRFKEGMIEGRGQKFHSDYSYRQNIILITP